MFDLLIEGIQEDQEAIPIEKDSESEMEYEFVVPSQKDNLNALQILQMYELAWRDEYVLDRNLDLGLYQDIVQSSIEKEKYQTKISDFCITGEKQFQGINNTQFI